MKSKFTIIVVNGVPRSWAQSSYVIPESFHFMIFSLICLKIRFTSSLGRHFLSVSLNVIIHCTCALTHSVDHAASWKLIRSHFLAIYHDVVFPMMCYSDDDDQLWQEDPYEYIRMKFGECNRLFTVTPTYIVIPYSGKFIFARANFHRMPQEITDNEIFAFVIFVLQCQ